MEKEKLVNSEILFKAPAVSEDAKKIILPKSDIAGYELQLYASSNEQIVDLAGNIHTPLEDMNLTVMYKLVGENDVVFAKNEVEIAVKGLYTEEKGDNPRPNVLPAIREWKGLNGEFKTTDDSRIVIKDEALREEAEMLSYYCEKMLGFKLSIITGNPQAGDFYIALGGDASLSDEGYFIEIKDIVKISAYNQKAILYSAATLVQIMSQSDDKRTLPCGIIRDYPAYPARACMIDCARFYMPIEYLEEIGRYMAYYKLNELHVHLNDNRGQQKCAFRLESKKYPKINSGNRDGKVYTQDEYRDFQKKLLKYGVTVVSEIDSPAHCEFVALHNPDYILNIETNTTEKHLDIYNPEAVNFMKSLWEEFTEGDDPVFIKESRLHIGGDEYFLFNKELFAKHRGNVPHYMQTIAQPLLDKGYKLSMWGHFGTDIYDYHNFEELSREIRGYNATRSPWEQVEHGFSYINVHHGFLYIVPGTPPRIYGDYRPIEEIYSLFDVNVYDEVWDLKKVPAALPNLVGAGAYFWGDYDLSWTPHFVFTLIHKVMMVVCEKTWQGVNPKHTSLEDFLNRVGKLGIHSPDANPIKHENLLPKTFNWK